MITFVIILINQNLWKSGPHLILYLSAKKKTHIIISWNPIYHELITPFHPDKHVLMLFMWEKIYPVLNENKLLDLDFNYIRSFFFLLLNQGVWDPTEI